MATVAKPADWIVDQTDGSLRIHWSMRRGSLYFFIPFAIFWNGVLSAFAFAWSDGFTHPELLLVGLAVPHVWVGVALIYFCVASLWNTESISISDGVLSCTSRPVPMPGSCSIPTAEIDQVFVVERRGGKGSTTYEVCVLRTDGRRETFFSGVHDAVEARFLEVTIERTLGIRDVVVEGEFGR